MAARSTQSRARIPSVSDLLDKPPIRALANRWNRSVVAAGVRSFLDELRSDRGRRESESAWPSLRELAERAAKHVVALQQSSARPAINATGRIWGSPWVGRPQCEEALERAFAAGRDFMAGPLKACDQPFAADFEPRFCRMTGAEAATAVHSYAGGLWLALSALAAGREVIISRGDLGETETGCPLAPLITSSGAIITEVGAANRTSAGDYEAAIRPQTAALLRFCPETYRIVGETESAELEELVALARDRELSFIDAAGDAPLMDWPLSTSKPQRSITARIAAGATLVIARGDGFVGGPPCGILAGQRHAVELVMRHPLFGAWQIDAPRAAALLGTLHCWEESGDGATLPLTQLLAAPLENLRNRAERLAPQLAQLDGIAAAEAVPMNSPWGFDRESAVPTFGVALTAADGDLDRLRRRFSGGSVPVIGRADGERLMLDLRTVFPRQDSMIAEALTGGKATAQAAADSSSEH